MDKKILFLTSGHAVGGGPRVQRGILELEKDRLASFHIVTDKDQTTGQAPLLGYSCATLPNMFHPLVRFAPSRLGGYIQYLGFQRGYISHIKHITRKVTFDMIFGMNVSLHLTSRAGEVTDMPVSHYVLAHTELNPFVGRNVMERLHTSLAPLVDGATSRALFKRTGINCRVLTVSKYMCSWLKHDYGIPSKVIYPGIADIFKPMNPSLKKRYVLVVSPFAPFKRLDVAIRVFSKAKAKSRVKMIMVGYAGRNLQYLADLIKLRERLGLREKVEFLTDVDQHTILTLYREAKCFLFPRGLHDAICEPFPLVTIESLASGTPVIAPVRGGQAEQIVDGYNGFLVRDEEEMSCRLDEIISDEELRLRLSRNSPDSVSSYTIDAFKTRISAELMD